MYFSCARHCSKTFVWIETIITGTLGSEPIIISFADGKTGVQGGQVTNLMSHSWKVEEVGFEPRSWAPKTVGLPLFYNSKRKSFQTKGWWQSPGSTQVCTFLSVPFRVLRSQMSLFFVASSSLLAQELRGRAWSSGLGQGFWVPSDPLYF